MKKYFVTSIPPKLSRTDDAGIEIGFEYQDFCIESWSKIADSIISLNSAKEQLNPDIESKIDVIRCSVDAGNLVGRSLVYLSEFIEFARTLDDEDLIILGNADIFIFDKERINLLIEGMKADQVYAFRRLNVSNVNSNDGKLYASGLDVFLSRAGNIKAMNVDGFVFGETWWDHFFAVSCLMENFDLKILEMPVIGHLIHPERWNVKNWISFGEKYIKNVSLARIAYFSESSRLEIFFNKNFAFIKANFKFHSLGMTRIECFKFYYLNYISGLNVKIFDRYVKK